MPIQATGNDQPKDYDGTSPLGAPVYQPVTLVAEEQDFRLTLPPTTMLELQRGKKIVETEVVNGGAYVVQGINSGRWELTLSGRLVSQNRYKWPFEQARNLERMFLLRQALEIENRFVNERGIYQVYIQDMSQTPVSDYQNVVDFSLNCRQFVPLTLELKDEDQQPPQGPNQSTAEPLEDTPIEE